MTAIQTTQPWQQRPLNRSGIRRLKLAPAETLLLFPLVGLVPQASFEFYEFIFPSDLSCIATIQTQRSESGSVFWTPQVSFTLPHLSDPLVAWVASKRDTQWILIAEDYNGICRAFGGSPQGLDLSFQASTGSGPKDANPMGFSFSGAQIAPFTALPAYEDSILFPNNAAFSYGFSLGFNS